MRKKCAAYLVAFALVAASHALGWFDFLEHRITALQFRLLQHPASETLTIVEIDASSLRDVGVWPWPRTVYAQALQQLLDAGAAEIALDVDLSTHANAADDAALARVLERSDDRVLLPTMTQVSTADEFVWVQPIEEFRRSARLGSVNMLPDADGVTRRLESHLLFADRYAPTIPAIMAHQSHRTPRTFYLDFAIDPESIPRISFADVLAGRLDRRLIEGKKVIIGATASELEDRATVPVHAILPGVVLLSLAYETLIQQRDLIRLAPAVSIAIAGGIVLLLVPLLSHTRIAMRFIVVATSIAAIFTLSALAQELAGILVDTAFWSISCFVTLITSLLVLIRRQHLHLLVQGLHLHRQGMLMNNVVRHSSDGIVTVNRHGEIEAANEAATALLQRGVHEMLHESLASFISQFAPPADLAGRLVQMASKRDVEELTCVDSSGRLIPVEVLTTRMSFGDDRKFTLFIRDISERKRQQALLQRQALHDALTGLPNRTLLNDRIDSSIRFCKRHGGGFAVLFLDMDQFKEINDTLGHSVGDELLKKFSRRLESMLRATDTVSRLGGDEFAVLLNSVNALEDAEILAQKILEDLRTPIELGDVKLGIRVSIGIVLYPDHGDDATTLLQRADVAMYLAKREHLGATTYSAEKDQHTLRRLTIAGDLRKGIEAGELVLFYQPKIDIATRRFVSSEVLVRWDHPTLGFVQPEEFIAVGERSGLMKDLTKAVLAEAAAQWREWNDAGRSIPLAVNTSMGNLQDDGFATDVADLLEHYGMSAELLTLEATESAMMANPQHALRVFHDLQALGVRLSIDDYGTGYSSLSYLRDVPADELKIDMTFTSGILGDPVNREIVQSTISLAHALGLSVVAEGVESEEVLRLLARLECDVAQGFLFGPPLPAPRFVKWLTGCHTSQDELPEPPMSAAPVSDRTCI